MVASLGFAVIWFQASKGLGFGVWGEEHAQCVFHSLQESRGHGPRTGAPP